MTYSIRNDFIPVGFSKADQIDLVSLRRKGEKGDISTQGCQEKWESDPLCDILQWDQSILPVYITVWAWLESISSRTPPPKKDVPASDEKGVLDFCHQLKVQSVLRFIARRAAPEHRVLPWIWTRNKMQHYLGLVGHRINSMYWLGVYMPCIMALKKSPGNLMKTRCTT